MADFLTAYKRTARFEGGYANDPHDSGGETWEGVARNSNPHWIGWDIIDHYKKLPGFPGNLKASAELEKAVQDIFKKNYWDPIRGDEIHSQEIANQLYDNAINEGPGEAVILAKRAAGIKESIYMDQHFVDLLNNEA
jgi:lysozyme family protein